MQCNRLFLQNRLVTNDTKPILLQQTRTQPMQNTADVLRDSLQDTGVSERIHYGTIRCEFTEV